MSHFVIYSSVAFDFVTTTTYQMYRFFRDHILNGKTSVYRSSVAMLPMSPITSKIFTYIHVIHVL